MKKIISHVMAQPIVTGSIWITGGSLVVSIGNYLFNLLMGRLLTPADYGTLIALMSFSIVVSLPTGIISLIVTKFAADFFAKKEYAKMARLIKKFTRYTSVAGVIIMGGIMIAAPAVLSYLRIDDPWLLFLTALAIGVGIFSSVNSGVLRGMLYFRLLALIGMSGIAVKLLLGWHLVANGFLVSGALIGLLASLIIPWIVSYVPLRKFYTIASHEKLGLRRQVIAYSVPSFAVTSALMLFLSMDLLLVKHYFPPHEAGIYAAISVMGKAIFYLVAPAIQVIFPVIAQSFAQGKNILRDVLLGSLIVLVPAVCGVLFYTLFPEFVVMVFFPREDYGASIGLIHLYAVYMLLYALISLLANVFLAVEKASLTYIALVGALLQIVLVSLFHESLTQVLWVSIGVCCLLGAIYLYYLFKLVMDEKK